MKKRGFIHLLTWLFILIFAAGIIMPLSPAAKAEGNPHELPGVSFYMPDDTLVYLNSPATYWFGYENVSKKDITKLKSSNKNVATVKKVSEQYRIGVLITPKKTGKTTISFKFKHNNKTYSFKMVVTVKKYVNPFKSFKIGSSSFEEYLDSAEHTEAINAHVPLKKTLKKQKLNFMLKPGWEIQEIALFHGGKWNWTIKNGQKITIQKNDEIDFLIKDPKGYDIWFYFFFVQ